jgi:hypothetical protein
MKKHIGKHKSLYQPFQIFRGIQLKQTMNHKNTVQLHGNTTGNFYERCEIAHINV